MIEFYMKKLKTRTPPNPAIETIASITDHERSVSFKLKLKYSLNIQKPASFTCENIKLPAPSASTIRFGFTPD